MIQLIRISGKARQVFAVLEWISKVAGKVTLGDIIKFKEEQNGNRT